MTTTTTQIAVFLKNVPGALHAMLRALTDERINIEGLMISDAADHAVVRLVVDSPSKVLHLLGDRGAMVVESEIIDHEMANRPGELLTLSGKLAHGGINIAYIYGSTPKRGTRARIFIHTDDDAKVLRLLGKRRAGRPAARRR